MFGCQLISFRCCIIHSTIICSQARLAEQALLFIYCVTLKSVFVLSRRAFLRPLRSHSVTRWTLFGTTRSWMKHTSLRCRAATRFGTNFPSLRQKQEIHKLIQCLFCKHLLFHSDAYKLLAFCNIFMYNRMNTSTALLSAEGYIWHN